MSVGKIKIRLYVTTYWSVVPVIISEIYLFGVLGLVLLLIPLCCTMFTKDNEQTINNSNVLLQGFTDINLFK